MTKYLVIEKQSGVYKPHFTQLSTDDIEVAFSIIYKHTINDTVEDIARSLFHDNPELYEDEDAAEDVAYEMIIGENNLK